jgi:hypothetical protein
VAGPADDAPVTETQAIKEPFAEESSASTLPPLQEQVFATDPVSMNFNPSPWATPPPGLFDPMNRPVPPPDLSGPKVYELPSTFDRVLEQAPTIQDQALQWPSPLDSTSCSKTQPNVTPCDCCESHWTRTNVILRQANSIALKDVDCQETVDAHVIITVVTQGWARAAKILHLDAIWNLLRQLDETNFKDFGDVERIVSLRILRRMLKVRMQSALGYGEI